MREKIIIIGAGGHGKVIADIAKQCGYTEILFVDDNRSGACMGYPIIATSSDIEKLDDGNTDFVIAIGNNAIRRKIAEQHKLNWVSLIHPSVQIGENVQIGIGTVVMAGAVINADAIVGEHCIINTCAVIEHENSIEDFVHISPRVALAGNVHIGKNTHVGIGAIVINNIDICADCMIGAGAVVVKDITKSTTYIGVPARIISGGG